MLFELGRNLLYCRRLVQLSAGQRLIQTSASRWSPETSGSIFNSLGKQESAVTANDDNLDSISNKLAAASSDTAVSGDAENNAAKVTVQNDKRLQKYIQSIQQPQVPAPKLYLSPLKRQIYETNCKLNGGFYKKNTVVQLPHSPVQYKLNLSRQEIDALEPSVYVKSYRIKSSMKKVTQLLRLLNGLDVKKAITQCHFADKKVARDVVELLERGIEDGKQLGLNSDELYLAQIWTGSDGKWQKRMEFKGRGRVGVITHPYVHIRCILKSKNVTKKRLEYEAKQKENRKKPWVQLADKPVRGVTGGVYKW